MFDEHKSNRRGPGRTIRQDWVNAALDTLVCEGAEQVKVLTLAATLDCPRSSFYWYFKNRKELMDALLEHWEATNTKALIDASTQDADTICLAMAKLFGNWVYGTDFDTKLDFAIRDWARRCDRVRGALEASDDTRIGAIEAMFKRFGYDDQECDVRARIVYFTQIGYATLDQRETWETRMTRGAAYLYCMTGQHPTAAEAETLQMYRPKDT